MYTEKSRLKSSKTGNKQFILALVLIAAVTGLIVLFVQNYRTNVKEHRVGAVFSLTGGTAYWSEQLKLGMDMALEEDNTGKNAPVRVIYEDVQGQPQIAATAFQKLTDVDEVELVISVFTPISQPLRPLAEKVQVPLFATVVTVRDFNKGFNWTFRDFLTQEEMAAPLGIYAVKKMDLKSAAALIVNDDFGRDGARAFAETFAQNGGEWLGEETFAQNDTDIRSQAAKLSSRNPKAVLVIGRDQSQALAIRQLREANFNGQILGVASMDQETLYNLSGDAINGAVFTSAYFDLQNNSAAADFAAKFRAKNNTQPSYVVIYGYTMMKYLTPILRQSGGNREAVKSALEKLNVSSLRGQLKMDGAHNVRSPVGVYKVVGRTKQIIETPQTLTEVNEK